MLKQAGLLFRWKVRPSRKGTGFEQPLQPHQHWRIDISYINLCGTFYYLCSHSGWVQSFPRALGSALVHTRSGCRSDPAASQGEVPGSETANHLRQWTAVHCSRLQGVHSPLGHDAHPNLPLSANGKIERWHKSLKSECIRSGTRYRWKMRGVWSRATWSITTISV